jgi:hypothetical protein
MTLTPQRFALAVALTLPALAQATPFSIFEARGFAMGGAGVASSEYAAAALYNPALLAAPSDANRFSFILPAVGARVTGNDGAFSTLKDFQDSKSLDDFNLAANHFNSSLEAYNANKTTTTGNALNSSAASLQVAAESVLSDLRAVDQKTYQLNAGTVAVLALPKWEYKGALSLNVEFFGRATTNVSSSDTSLISATVSDVVTGTSNYVSSNGTNAGSLSSYVTGNQLSVGGDANKPKSSMHIVGVAVADFGVSFAKAFTVADESVLLGLTPKIQQVNTVAYDADVDSTEFKFSDNKKTSTGFNLDLGVAKTFEAGRYENLRLGLVVRNLIPHTYKTSLSNQDVKMTPQLRVGAAWVGKYGTVTSDLDLTANKIVGTGSDSSQVFALGGEVNAWNVAKLRLGFRNDIKAKYSAITAGVSLLGIQLSTAYSKDRELAALLQFGASF